MPNYTFVNTEDNSEITLSLKIAEYEDYKRLNPNMRQIFSPTPLKVNSSLKPNDGFRDVLKEIKSNHIRSNINTF